MAESTVSFVQGLRSSLPESHEWTERDAAVLELAERQAADIDRLERDIAENGTRVEGRRAEVLNQAFAEVRQARVALGRLLGLVEIPGEPSTGAQHGRKATLARGGLMPRLRNRGYDPRGRERLDLLLALRMGPDIYDHGFSDEELRVGWEVYGQRIMEAKPGRGPGTRPWGWWRFVAGEEQPEERWNPDTGHVEDHGIETIRLAELGELTREELAALEEDANVARPRIGTPAERISGGGRNSPGAYSVDQQDVDLWEAVDAALGGGNR